MTCNFRETATPAAAAAADTSVCKKGGKCNACSHSNCFLGAFSLLSHCILTFKLYCKCGLLKKVFLLVLLFSRCREFQNPISNEKIRIGGS